MKKIIILNLELHAQVFFALDEYLLKIWVENTVFAIQHIGNRKRFTEVLPPPPVTKLILYLNTSYKNGMIGHGGERCQNAQKQFIIKTYQELILYKSVGKWHVSGL